MQFPAWREQDEVTVLHAAMAKVCSITIPLRRSSCTDRAKQTLAWRIPVPSSASALSSWRPPTLQHTAQQSALLLWVGNLTKQKFCAFKETFLHGGFGFHPMLNTEYSNSVMTRWWRALNMSYKHDDSLQVYDNAPFIIYIYYILFYVRSYPCPGHAVE